MKKIGYIMVSTPEQNEARQFEILKPYEIDKVFKEKVSAKDVKRPKFLEMLEYVRPGDTVYTCDFSRISRSVRDLLKIIEILKSKGVSLVSVKESLDLLTPQGKLMVTMIGAINEFEREIMLERQREGIALAKKQGKFKGRKPKFESLEKFAEEYKKHYNPLVKIKDLVKKLNLSNEAYRTYLKKSVAEGLL